MLILVLVYWILNIFNIIVYIRDVCVFLVFMFRLVVLSDFIDYNYFNIFEFDWFKLSFVFGIDFRIVCVIFLLLDNCVLCLFNKI